MKKFFIIDGNSYIYRAYHAIKELKNKDGFPTNAIYGFLSMLFKVLEEKPENILIVFDAAKKTFRNDLFPDYKANRAPMPDDLIVQIPYIKKALDAFNICKIEEEGFEADDIIATIVKQYKDTNKIVIVSSDKDLTQLLDSNVIMWDTLKDFKYTANNIVEKYKIPQKYILDYFSLIGDSSDNIPGVKGIGPKTASKLINEFGSIENLYKSIDKVKPERIQKLLIANKDKAFLSKNLFKLKDDVPIEISEKNISIKNPNKEKLKKLFNELDFHSFVKKFDLGDEKKEIEYEIVNNLKHSDIYSAVVLKYKEGFFSQNFLGAFTENGRDVFITDNFEEIKKILTSKKILGYNIKQYSKNIGYFIDNFEDIQLLGYIVNPEEKNTIERLSYIYLNKFVKPIEDYKKKRNVKIDFMKLSFEEKQKYISERVCSIYHCYNVMVKKIDGNLLKLYKNIEKPLINVLFKMEKNGIYVDKDELKKIGQVLNNSLQKLVDKIYIVAEEKFNINSPKQLREILFEKLKLEIVKKTKTGASTDNEVLEYLSSKHPLPKYILEYREKSKIYSTYIEGLLKAINSETKRIHPTFNQTITATGRLSCTNPNIQNIPIRTEYGDMIRKAFSVEEKNLLVSFDYSQIELRLMAHFSEDEELINAFKNNIDIHVLTASKIYGKNVEEVDEQMRRDGKTVNFAIIYGISPYGLAKSLKITRDKAKIFIENYFNEYKGVKNFIDKFVLMAKDKGYVETLTGRRRYIRGINSRNHQEREFAKRIAINTPIQGTAADIIKIAMIKIDEISDKYNAKMIMQIHDELIFEVPENNIRNFSKHTKEIMENIFPNLKVNLKVDIGVGKTWYEAH